MDDQLRSLISDNNTDDSPIDMMEYWRIVDRFKWRIVAFTVVITILATLYALSLIPQYSASVKLIIEAEKANTVSVREIYDVNDNNRTYYMTQFEILKSNQMAQKVIHELDLLSKPEYDQLIPRFAEQTGISTESVLSYLNTGVGSGGESISEAEVERLALQSASEIFLKKLSFQPIRNTQLVKITYDSADPKLAAEVVNGLAEIYIRSFLESKLEMEAKASAWMNERMATIKEKLNITESNLQAFLEKEGLVDVRGVSSLAQRELDDLSTQLSLARTRVSQSKNINDLSSDSEQSIDDLMRIPDVINHPVVRQVKNAEIQANQRITELKLRYGPKHLRMIAAYAELDSVRATLEAEVRKLVEGIATEYKTAIADLRAIEKKLNKAKNDFQQLSRVEREYKRLQSEVQINQELYSTFFTRLKETSETTGFQTSNARILDRATPPPWPSKPSKKKIVAIAMLAAFAFAVGLAFLYDFLGAGIRNLDDIEKRLRQRMLGLIPLQKLKKGEELQHDLFFDKKAKGFSEAIRTIRTSLLMSQMEKPPKIIAITSSIPNEGKSVLATNLAYALGQMERVLLIDADLRRPSLGKRFGYPPYQPGLSNLIANTANLSSCIMRDAKSGIDLLVAGAIPPNPQELLSSDLMKTAMKLLSAKYDRIIIDTAPTQAVSDSLIVSTHADAMIYVVKADSTHYKNIKAGIGRLLQIGANVAGVVLNQVDLEQSAKYGDYEGYYDQYGYNEDSQQVEESQPRAEDIEESSDLNQPPKFK